jgi:3'(2'), 5'-bisphosphate nucleotidase
MDLQSFIEPVVALAAEAGQAILEVYATDFEVQTKADTSPLTQADMASQRLIDEGLRTLTPALPNISEETGLPDFAVRSQWPRYWLIDPLDGTKEFVGRNGEFTVNIALIDAGKPVFGVVHIPVSGKTYVGCEGHGAERRTGHGSIEPIRVAGKSRQPVQVVGSRSHRSAEFEAVLERLGEFEMQPMGSSMKFCCVAEGSADIYPRLGPTSEWDTAAAQAVVEQAGGQVLTFDGAPLCYNGKADILNPSFLVVGPCDRDWLTILSPGT